MTDDLPSPAALARIALDVATEAAQLALRGFRQHPDVTKKGRTDLVTEHDLASERLVRERLAALTPGLPVIGEEEGGARARGPVWYCDPIDGTTNFVHGHPFWCVSLGLLDDGKPVVGAVVAPALATSWWAAVGDFALRNGDPCRVSDTASIDDALVATGFPQDRRAAPGNNFDSFVKVKQRVQGVRRCGSAALDLCLVADGTYDAYWERKLNLWDVAAGAALVLAAGGRLTALDGAPVDLTYGDVLASNGHVHDALVAVLGE